MLIGLSGGSDSVALTHVLLALSEHGGFEVAALAHLNHQLRPDAARDEAFCREFAARVARPLVVETIDVRAHAAAQGLSVEDAARRLRYGFLERAAAQVRADRIAVGHTEDDQAETFLLKLMRGAGLTGLGGIYPRRGQVIRPLLDVSRADLRAYLENRREAWVDDLTNDDLANPRNRVRHLVLPELDRAAGGPTRPALARAAALAREDGQLLDELAEAAWRELVSPIDRDLEIDAADLSGRPGPIARRVLLRALRQLAGDREVVLDHVLAAMAVLGGFSGGVDVPGGRVELRAGKLVLRQQKPVSK